MSELKPDAEGFRYVLMWLRELKKGRDLSIQSLQSYLLEWEGFIVDAEKRIKELETQLANEFFRVQHDEYGQIVSVIQVDGDGNEVAVIAKSEARQPSAQVPEVWQSEFDALFDDYVGACMETAVFNATQKSGMTIRMAKPRLVKLLAHVAMLNKSQEG
jgi:hypothetical protein